MTYRIANPIVDPDTGEPYGDCLVHAEHHPLRQECWSSIVRFVFECQDHGITDAEAMERYKREYERAAMTKLVQQQKEPQLVREALRLHESASTRDVLQRIERLRSERYVLAQELLSKPDDESSSSLEPTGANPQ